MTNFHGQSIAAALRASGYALMAEISEDESRLDGEEAHIEIA